MTAHLIALLTIYSRSDGVSALCHHPGDLPRPRRSSSRMRGEWHPGKAVPAANPCRVVCPEFGCLDANGQRQLDAECADNGTFVFLGDVGVEQAQMRGVGLGFQ